MSKFGKTFFLLQKLNVVWLKKNYNSF